MTDQTPTPPTPSGTPPVARQEWNLAGIVIGLDILCVGVYFLLRETLQVAIPDIGEFWPVFVIVLGAAFLYGGLRRANA
jgi:hypothetical protein